jgi:biopolymer transport protein ExbD
MRFQRKRRQPVDITLISMIDVLFVLLLFFMVSTTFNRHTEVKIKPKTNLKVLMLQSMLKAFII